MSFDGFEILKRAWHHVSRNRFLWPLGFFIALAGGGSQGLSLWVQSPVLRGITGLSPLHRAGERIAESARDNTFFWVVFLAVGAAVAVGVLLFSALAQVGAIGGVAQVEKGRQGDLRNSLRWGRHAYLRYFALLVGYTVILAALSAPFYLLALVSRGRGNVVFPCISWLILAAGFLAASMLTAVVLEFSARYLVLGDLGIVESLRAACSLIRRFLAETVVTWLYVMLIMLAGTVATAILLALLATPLTWLFATAYRQQNPLLISLSILGFLLTWAAAAALAGGFAVTGSAVWTLAFMELEPEVARE